MHIVILKYYYSLGYKLITDFVVFYFQMYFSYVPSLHWICSSIKKNTSSTNDFNVYAYYDVTNLNLIRQKQ